MAGPPRRSIGVGSTGQPTHAPLRGLLEWAITGSSTPFLFGPLRTVLTFQQEQFFADECVELVRAGRILGKAAHAFAIASFPRIQGLRRFKTLLGFSEPIHFQAQESELVVGFTELRI